MSISITEENYIKAIFHLSLSDDENISTNEIAIAVNATAASVSDMLKKLKAKKYVRYEKYQGVRLTRDGEKLAKNIVRKHRLWEVFLTEKLNYNWDEVHEIAEQLEHIQSDELINRLDKFLGFPKYDPHGDPIPDASGNINNAKNITLSELEKGETATVTGVKDSSSVFLQYLSSIGIGLGTQLSLIEKIPYDGTLVVKCGRKNISLSRQSTQNIIIQQ